MESARRDEACRLKNLESLIRDVSCRRLEDQSRNIRVVVADVVTACTVGGAIYRRPRELSARGCLTSYHGDTIYIF